MSRRIRGQEVLISFLVEDAGGGFVPLGGSFFKVQEFRVTPRTDLVEESFLGEPWDDLDVQHHGYDGSFQVQNEDALALEFFQSLVENELNGLRPYGISIQVQYSYRSPDEPNRQVVYRGVVMKVSEESISGRKDYVTTSFEFKAKERALLFTP